MSLFIICIKSALFGQSNLFMSETRVWSHVSATGEQTVLCIWILDTNHIKRQLTFSLAWLWSQVLIQEGWNQHTQGTGMSTGKKKKKRSRAWKDASSSVLAYTHCLRPHVSASKYWETSKTWMDSWGSKYLEQQHGKVGLDHLSQWCMNTYTEAKAKQSRESSRVMWSKQWCWEGREISVEAMWGESILVILAFTHSFSSNEALWGVHTAT